MQKSSKIVAILNLTPDSFSDGGQYSDRNSALKTASKMLEDGADILDIGAESTRPGATPLTPDEEWGRLREILPQICVMASAAGALTSIDTRHAATARQAIATGIDWVNDVSACADAEMLAALHNWPGKLVIMHNLGIPSDKNITLAANLNPITEIKQWLASRLEFLEENGLDRTRIIIDPGIGFGKTAAQSWEIINHIAELGYLGSEIMVGHSRKSFLTAAPNSKGEDASWRDAATLEVSRQLVASGVTYLRVHNVALHKQNL